MTINRIRSAVELSEGNLHMKVTNDQLQKKCVIVREVNRKKRVVWCRGKRKWTVDSHWRKYIF